MFYRIPHDKGYVRRRGVPRAWMAEMMIALRKPDLRAENKASAKSIFRRLATRPPTGLFARKHSTNSAHYTGLVARILFIRCCLTRIRSRKWAVPALPKHAAPASAAAIS